MEVQLHVRASIIVFAVLTLTVVARGEDIELITGEVLEGAVILEQLTDTIEIEHPILGRLSIRVGDVRTIDGRDLSIARLPGATPQVASEPPPEPVAEAGPQAAPEAIPEAAPVEVPVAAPPEPTTPPPAQDTPRPPRMAPSMELVPWTSQLEFGGTLTDGATETTNFITRYETSRKAEQNLTRVNMNYRFSTNQGERNVNRFDVGLFTEWTDPDSNWNLFIQGRFENAEFQAWNQRVTTSGGLGYELLDTKSVDENGAPVDLFTLTGRLGGGMRQEFGSDDTSVVPEGLVGLDFTYRLSADQNITGNSRYFPDLDKGGEFRVETSAQWTIAIDRHKGVSLRLGVQHEYDSQSPSNIPENDFAARASLVINF